MAKPNLDLSLEKDRGLEQRLRDDYRIWLTSVTASGRPQSAIVWFVWDGKTFLIFSKPGPKVRNLQNNPNVVLALEDTKNGADPLTIEGTAELLPVGEIDIANSAFAKKYAQLMGSSSRVAEAMAQDYTQAIRITPTRFIAFGLK